MRNGWVVATVGIAVTGLAYGIAYLREYGFFSIFKVPADLIQIESTGLVESVLTAVIVLGTASLAFYLINLRLFPYLEKAYPVLKELWLAYLFLIIISYLPLALIYQSLWQEWVWFIVPWVGGWVVGGPIFAAIMRILQLPRFQRFSKARFANEPNDTTKGTARDRMTDTGKTQDQPLSFMRAFKLPSIFFLVLTIAFLVFYSLLIGYSTGRADAIKQNTFLVTPNPQESVVLRVYGNTMICAPLDREKRTIANEFFIISTTNGLPVYLKMEQIGPLKLEAP